MQLIARTASLLFCVCELIPTLTWQRSEGKLLPHRSCLLMQRGNCPCLSQSVIWARNGPDIGTKAHGLSRQRDRDSATTNRNSLVGDFAMSRHPSYFFHPQHVSTNNPCASFPLSIRLSRPLNPFIPRTVPIFISTKQGNTQMDLDWEGCVRV